jgi:hypothetical protein
MSREPERCPACSAPIQRWKLLTYEYLSGGRHRCPPDLDIGTVEADYLRMMREHVGETPEDVLARLRGIPLPDTPETPEPHPGVTAEHLTAQRVAGQREPERPRTGAATRVWPARPESVAPKPGAAEPRRVRGISLSA